MKQDARQPAVGDRPWLAALSRNELDSLLQIRDLRAVVSFLVDWGIVAASFWLVAVAPSLITVIIALVLIGARQLGFAVLMHEAAHRTLFSNRSVNDFVGNWLCAFPIWSDLHPYRPYHLQHHAKNWTDEDPDLALATPFPITRDSLRRKIWRDLSGQTGWKRAKATLARDLGKSQGRVQRLDFTGTRNLRGVVITNLCLLAILAGFGHAELYLLWAVAWLTTYSLAMRVRSIAEHSMALDPTNPLQNSRTMLARWWERLILAPNRVNFHLEHHLYMTVPHYNLPRLHRLLKARGVLDDACIEHGYFRLLSLASSKAA